MSNERFPAARTPLRVALEDALEGLEEMLPYIDGYFVEKWGLAEYVERAKAALGNAPEGFTWETRDAGEHQWGAAPDPRTWRVCRFCGEWQNALARPRCPSKQERRLVGPWEPVGEEKR